jgi:nucleotide-binding universal stress UspA family protein
MYEHILIPMDGSKLAECVLPYVNTFIDSKQTKTATFVRVLDPVIMPAVVDGMVDMKILDSIAEQEIADAENYLKRLEHRVKHEGIKAVLTIQRGNAADFIIDLIREEKIDLVIMATHGRSGISHWFWGSVADRVLHASPVPVLLVRPKECGNAFA